MIQRLSNLAMALGVGFVAAQSCLYTVDPGEKVTVVSLRRLSWTVCAGSARRLLGRGSIPTYLLSKYHSHKTQKPIIYDCRMRPIDINVQTGTKDLQTVTISLRVLHHPIS